MSVGMCATVPSGLLATSLEHLDQCRLPSLDALLPCSEDRLLDANCYRLLGRVGELFAARELDVHEAEQFACGLLRCFVGQLPNDRCIVVNQLWLHRAPSISSVMIASHFVLRAACCWPSTTMDPNQSGKRRSTMRFAGVSGFRK